MSHIRRTGGEGELSRWRAELEKNKGQTPAKVRGDEEDTPDNTTTNDEDDDKDEEKSPKCSADADAANVDEVADVEPQDPDGEPEERATETNP